ncbi:MAG TPA: GMC family oxidoreductase [Spongiibacteraceae bacterium]|nr:GMC family oxidoreductase [Spongiibacteraceae bacterium]
MQSSFDFDAIVVGSGVTGGWAAKELTEKGLKVLILERGKPLEHGKDYVTEHMEPWKIPFGGKPNRELYARDYPIQSNCYAFDETTRHFWNNDRENPYVFDKEKPFYWLRADVVGGKSLMWGRQVYRWSDLDFEANKKDGHGIDWPIRYNDIKDWYSYVEKTIGVSGQAENLSQLPDSEFQPAMQMNSVEKVIKQRIEAAYKERKMTIGRVANLTEPLGDRGACHYCGVCQRGCSVGAYFSSHSCTLPAARKTGNLSLRANSVVEGLDYDPASKRIAAVRVIDSVTKEKSRITARMVFLCASTVGSVQILLNSKSESFPNGLANRSGTLGQYMMDHTDNISAIGITGEFPGKYYYGIRPNGIYLPRFRNLKGRDTDVDFERGYGFQGMAMPLEWKASAAQTPGFGVAFKNALRQPKLWVMALAGFGECLPYKDNRILLDDKLVDRYGIPQVRFEITYRDNELRMQADATKQAAEMLKAAKMGFVMPVGKGGPPGSAIHEMGGARMGLDPKQSVLNAHNQAHDISNLFVTDGSCMASSSCVNPSLTFMALTARAADYAVTQLRAGKV